MFVERSVRRKVGIARARARAVRDSRGMPGIFVSVEWLLSLLDEGQGSRTARNAVAYRDPEAA